MLRNNADAILSLDCLWCCYPAGELCSLILGGSGVGESAPGQLARRLTVVSKGARV